MSYHMIINFVLRHDNCTAFTLHGIRLKIFFVVFTQQRKENKIKSDTSREHFNKKTK